MADYWKSQTRKYCEFCKCWIADNKPTIQYHENGKRHKENVAKKISEMAKKSVKQHKEKAKVDDEMKKMEEEAMKAYMKDVELKADYTSKLLREKIKKAKEEADEDDDEEEEDEEDEELEAKKTEEVEKLNKKPNKSTDKSVSAKVWYEGKSDEGYSYYWNIHTNESTWEEPEGGFVSVAEQKKEEERAERAERAKADAARAAKAKEAGEKGEELRAFIAREAMKRFRPKEEEEKEEEEAAAPSLLSSFGPAPRVDPYGAWTTVQPVVVKEIDLQLPKPTHPVSYPVVSQTYEPRLVIKEKTVGSLGEGASDGGGEAIGFKKRKLKGGRSNLRQRTSELDDIE